MGRWAAISPVDGALLVADRALDVNLSRAAEEGNRLARVKAERWRKGNAKAFETHNRFVGEQGLPLERYRGF